jgi:hypothetical protein
MSAISAEDIYSKICTEMAVNAEAIVHALENPNAGIDRVNSVMFDSTHILDVIKKFKTRAFTASKNMQFTAVEFIKVMLLQNQISSMSSKSKRIIKLVKESARKELRDSIRVSLQPLLVAVQQTRRISYSFKNTGIEYASLPESGQYNLSTSISYGSSFIPGIHTNIFRASKSQVLLETSYSSFLVFQLPPQVSRNDLPPSILESITSLKPHIASTSRIIPVVRLVEGVEFTALSDSMLLVYEWNTKWKSLKSLCLQHGGLLSNGFFELFSLLAAKILDAVIGAHKDDILVRSLSPSTIIIDESGTNIRLLLLPVSSRVEECNFPVVESISSNIDAVFERSFLPNDGLDKNFNEESWDSWSFGMCLYFMAFGNHCSSTYDIEEPRSDDNTLLNDIVNGFYLDTSRLYGNSHKIDDSKVFVDLLSTVSTEMVFSVFEMKNRYKLTELENFRKTFCDIAPSYGLVLSSAYVLWEKIVASIFSVFSPGSTSFKSVEERLFMRCKSKSSEGIREFCELSLGLQLTGQEFNLFLASLNHAKDSSSLMIDGVKALKKLSVLLRDIRTYGYFQQTIYVVSRCLTVNSAQRPSMTELRSLPIFSLCEEISVMKATEDSKLLIAPFKNAIDFCAQEILSPFQQCTERLLDASVNFSRDHLEVNIRTFSKVLTILEELLLINIDLTGVEKVENVNHTLQDIGLNSTWLTVHLPDIFCCLSAEGAFRAIAFLTLRISRIDEAREIKHLSKGASSTRFFFFSH